MSVDLVNLPEWRIRAIFARAGQRHSEDRFLSSFAAAVCLAGQADFRLVRPLALLMIDKYGLLSAEREPPIQLQARAG